MAKKMSKRFNLRLPDGVATGLEEWARKEGNKPSTLAAFLIEQAIRNAADRGLIEPIGGTAQKDD